LWFLPLALAITPGSGHPSPFDTAWALAVVATIVAWATWTSSADVRGVRAETPALLEGNRA
jgi:hypothetical protein